jgi:hypothetical protein
VLFLVNFYSVVANRYNWTRLFYSCDFVVSNLSCTIWTVPQNVLKKKYCSAIQPIIFLVAYFFKNYFQVSKSTDSFFFNYHDIDTKFQPLLAIINLRRRTCEAHKVGSPLPTKFSLNAWEGIKPLTIYFKDQISYQLDQFIIGILMNSHVYLISMITT